MFVISFSELDGVVFIGMCVGLGPYTHPYIHYTFYTPPFTPFQSITIARH